MVILHQESPSYGLAFELPDRIRGLLTVSEDRFPSPPTLVTAPFPGRLAERVASGETRRFTFDVTLHSCFSVTIFVTELATIR